VCSPSQHRVHVEVLACIEGVVIEQVHDRQRLAGGAEAGGEDHVADLAHGGGGQRLLDVVLRAADDRAEQEGDRADGDHGGPRGGGGVEDQVGPGDEVDAGGDHGRGVDEGRHRGG